ERSRSSKSRSRGPRMKKKPRVMPAGAGSQSLHSYRAPCGRMVPEVALLFPWTEEVGQLDRCRDGGRARIAERIRRLRCPVRVDVPHQVDRLNGVERGVAMRGHLEIAASL